MIRFFVPGRPTGKGRPRATVVGKTEIITTAYGPMILKRGRPKLYTPKKTIDYEDAIRNAYLDKYQKRTDTRGPLWIKVIIYFKVPKAASKEKRRRMLEGEIRPEGQGDGDNILKIAMDALQGFAYKNDMIIAKGMFDKKYGDREGVWVEIDQFNAIRWVEN